ncbi:MAG: Maf family protein [Acidobacteriota bacterium]
MITLPKLLLASGSPRRAAILRSVGWEFSVVVPDIDETELPGEAPDVYVQRLAREKADAVALKEPDASLILAADTTVVAEGQILGKPVDLDDARRMIRILAGRDHEVLTGVALVKDGAATIGLERTTVTFAAMTETEIEFLAVTGDPLDKAGAYAVQAQAALFITGIRGDHWNIVGLPINLVYRLMTNLQA